MTRPFPETLSIGEKIVPVNRGLGSDGSGILHYLYPLITFSRPRLQTLHWKEQQEPPELEAQQGAAVRLNHLPESVVSRGKVLKTALDSARP